MKNDLSFQHPFSHVFLSARGRLGNTATLPVVNEYYLPQRKVAFHDLSPTLTYALST
jgi:hypothetical protein